MSIADQIRQLTEDGVSIAEIAKRLGIRYQHAYAVVKSCGKLPVRQKAAPPPDPKPELNVQTLVESGFALSASWMLSADGALAVEGKLPRAVGVYAFVKSGIAMYVGVATMGLSKRLYFYARPGATQLTSLRINGILRAELQNIPSIEIYTAEPPDLQWNGLPIHGSAGLELGIIKKFSLPWNRRSAGRQANDESRT